MGGVWERRRHSVREAFVALAPVLVVVSGIVALAVHDAFAGHIGVGELAVVLQAVLVAMACATITVQDSMVALGVATLEATLELEAATQSQASLGGTRAAADLPRREVRFDAVHFAYPGRGKEVLAGVDLVVPAGKSLALVGENGAGKTTLIKLLARLVDPTAGTVRVDGTSFKGHRPVFLAAALGGRLPGVPSLPLVCGREHRPQ